GGARQTRFCACCRRGDARRWRGQPSVQLQVRRLDGFSQRAEREWPLASTSWRRLYLRPGSGELSEAAGSGQERQSYRADGDGVTFIADPAGRETEITGPV